MKDERRRDLAEAERVARDAAKDLGLEIVEFVFHSQGRHSQLRIDVDRPGSRGVGLADCERLSRALDELLDRLDFFEAPYELQVSSPGIDRPIRSDDDIRRNTGRPIRLTFKDGTGKIREITGTLSGADGPEQVRLETERGEVTVARDAIVLMKQDVSTSGPRRNEA
jgi:ribosome maturation factor RimP